MSEYLSFKSPELETQFWSFLTQPTIRAIVRELGYFCATEKLPMPVITCVWRTLDEEQKLNPTLADKSPHIIDKDNPLCRAIDIRLHDDYYTNQEIWKLLAFINRFFPRTDNFKTALAHGEDSNYHLHIQCENL